MMEELNAEQNLEKKAHNLRERKAKPKINYLENEEDIFGDILEDDASKKKRWKKSKPLSEKNKDSEVPEEEGSEELVSSDQEWGTAPKNRKRKKKTNGGKDEKNKNNGEEMEIEIEKEEQKDSNEIKEEDPPKEKKKLKKKIEKETVENPDNVPETEKMITENQNPVNFDLGNIIDMSELAKKNSFTNSEYILAIMEICLNPTKYNFQNSNCTRNFWEEVANKDEIYSILQQFMPETLRKYWRIIRDTNNYPQVIELVHKYSKKINDPSLKLLPILNMISQYLQEPDMGFEDYIDSITKIKTKNSKVEKITSPEGKPNEENSGNTPFYINKKRRKSGIEEDFKQIQQKIKEKGSIPKNIITEDLDSQHDEEIIEQKDNTLSSDFSPRNDHQLNEKEMFVILDELLTTFAEHFKSISTDEIIETLMKVSGNIQNAYLYLSDPEQFKDLCFVKREDYIIQHLRDKPYYEDLKSLKGKELIKEREKFLNIN